MGIKKDAIDKAPIINNDGSRGEDLAKNVKTEIDTILSAEYDESNAKFSHKIDDVILSFYLEAPI